jgi:hypothetical protein
MAVAFAGVQNRCRVTHICLLLTEYLCRQGQRAVYVEAGKKRDVSLMCREEGRINLVSAKEFFYPVKDRKASCLRMPYWDFVPDKDKELSGLLESLLKRSLYERDICCGKDKGKENKEASKNSLFGRCRTRCGSDSYRHFAGGIFRRKTRGADAVSGGKQP